MEAFPIRIGLLSRYRSAKEQKETIRGLKDGTVDIVVGTHRLLSDDVKFKDLGLVIIDEEQRFGVKHKEKLKENFIGVDMLTLSATPIPRTLNMALSGIRDMSTIEQPPFERQPIETYVLEYDDAIIAEAIRRELARGGQVYYLYNRVETIEQCAAKVQKLVPGARVGIAHGKMTEEQISSVWQQLLDNEIDVLVCTTLIETGVDVRNCNTLIIEDADRMGLAQLYQIRGRVGRSGRKAYAYFTFRRDKTLTDIAQKRLDKALELGARRIIRGDQQDAVAALMADGGCDLVFDAAGSPVTALQATKVVASNGVVVMVGMAANPEIKLDMGTMAAREARLETIFRYRNHYPTAIASVASGVIPLAKIASHVFPFSDIAEKVLFSMDHPEEVIKGVISFVD